MHFILPLLSCIHKSYSDASSSIAINQIVTYSAVLLYYILWHGMFIIIITCQSSSSQYVQFRIHLIQISPTTSLSSLSSSSSYVMTDCITHSLTHSLSTSIASYLSYFTHPSDYMKSILRSCYVLRPVAIVMTSLPSYQCITSHQ